MNPALIESSDGGMKPPTVSPAAVSITRRVDGVMVMLWSFIVFCFAALGYVLWSLAEKCSGN